MEAPTFAINACDRCRKRKARCDPGIPSCRSCQAATSICAYTDPRTKQVKPRSQIIELEKEITQLEARLRQLGRNEDPEDALLESRASPAGRDSAGEDQYPDLIRLEAGGDGHFLGASSGLHLARSILESARRNSTAFDGHESLGPQAHRQVSVEQDVDVAEIGLPPWDTTIGLMDVYFRQYEIQYPILTRDELMRDAQGLYFCNDARPKDPWVLFMLNMVLSISLHLMSSEDSDSTNLSSRFRRNATVQLSKVMKTKNHQTLQCLLLLLLSSTLSSRSAPLWYISGICMRMCVDLGYHSERTIRLGNGGGEDTDVKRRLFWVTYTFDRSLAKMLGRPSFIDDDKINVEFPSSSLPEHAKTPVRLWLEMQRLQSEIISGGYISERSPQQIHRSSTPAWKIRIDTGLSQWRDETKRPGAPDGSMDWEYWYQHARLMLHQPRTSATKESLSTSFEAAKSMVRHSFIRAHHSVAALTWLDIHLQLVSGLTLLFLVLRSPHIRAEAKSEWILFKGCVVEWQVILGKLAQRWDSMAKMERVLGRLADEVLNSIENDKLLEGHCIQRGESSRNERHDHVPLGDLDDASQRGHGHGRLALGTPNPGTAASSHTRRRGRRRDDGPDPPMQSNYPTTVQALERTPVLQTDGHDVSYPEDQGFGATPPFGTTNFSSIFGGNFLTGMDQYGPPLQLDLSLFDPSVEMMPDPFGLQWMGSEARWDTMLTDSVLNFNDELESEQS